MKIKILIASVLLLAAAFIHGIGGQLTDIAALEDTNLAPNLKIEIWSVWHLLTIDFLVSGIYLLFIYIKQSFTKEKTLLHFIAVRMLLYALTILVIVLCSNIKLLFVVPQWILLLIVSSLLVWQKPNAQN